MKRETDSDFLLGVIKGMMLSYKARSAYLGLDAVLGVATPLTCTRRTGWTRKKVMRNLTKLVSNGDLVLVKKREVSVKRQASSRRHGGVLPRRYVLLAYK